VNATCRETGANLPPVPGFSPRLPDGARRLLLAPAGTRAAGIAEEDFVYPMARCRGRMAVRDGAETGRLTHTILCLVAVRC